MSLGFKRFKTLKIFVHCRISGASGIWRVGVFLANFKCWSVVALQICEELHYCWSASIILKKSDTFKNIQDSVVNPYATNVIYISGAPSKARNANVVYIYGPTFGNAKTVSFYLLHIVSTLNQCREVSCVSHICV